MVRKLDKEQLISKAVEAARKAYAPYSNFHVGAALITKSGKIYLGANIENSSYGLTICAERTAAFRAVLEGEKEFDAIAIVSDSEDFTPPCGACRQVLSELCGKDLSVIMNNKKGEIKEMTLEELLPFSFDKENLE
ncbi:Cytidine deaminase [Melioribacter roseus P3M-2]|uniref:Cytidine deaminase n=1 Tax=Melioribacter roseus (strain DSM 23840 / JCM 17771 / VKM B-2668 / P3M-2) TaxID=1191523 RepID=I6ZUK5_MELRP|nr:cytidine deaminase [Melioribacter roseus]AFN75694.1 Cytidine deaminase [Melioribacter roseus P3M-2]